MIMNEKWLEELPQPIVDVYQKASIDITKVIISRIRSFEHLTPTDINRLNIAVRYMGTDLNKIKKIFELTTRLSENAVDNILSECAKSNDSFAKVYYEAKGIPAIKYNKDTYLSQLVKATEKQVNKDFASVFNLSGSTMCYKMVGRKPMPIKEAYTSIINEAVLKVKAGLSYNTIIRDAVKKLGSGVCVNQNGYARRIDSMVRQNVLDTVRQLSQEQMLYHGEQFGADGIELSAHAISAPDHIGVQGRQFSNEQYENMQSGLPCVDVFGEYHDGFERPIGMWNCKHFAMPIVLGITQQTYTDEELKAMEKNSNEKYQKTQKMRRMETDLRKWKEQRMLLESESDGAKYLQKKINKLQKGYNDYCKKNELTPQTNRASVYGYRPISVK